MTDPYVEISWQEPRFVPWWKKTNIGWRMGRYISGIHNPPIPTVGSMEIPSLPKGRMGMEELLQILRGTGLDGNSHLGNGEAVEVDPSNDLLPCGKPKPPIERTGTQVKELTLQTWLLRSHFQQSKTHWRKCYEYYIAHQPTPTQLDQDNRFKPTDVDKALGRVKFPASTGPVLQVIQGIRDFEGQLVRAMKGISLACVLYSKLLLHGVHVDLERLQSKKTAAKQEALSFDKDNVEESFMQTLESRVHAWLVDVVPRDIQNKASNRAHTLSARMLIVEYYYTAIPGPDTIGFAMSRFIRTPTNTATSGLEVLANIESWKTAIQINYEVTKTMPSQQKIRAAFSRLISPLKVADEAFKFHQDLIVSQTFETQKVSDDEVLKYFQQTEEKIHSMDTRKQLKFPDKSPPSKTNAINSGDHLSRKEKGIKGLNRSLLLKMNSRGRRDPHRRRWKREQERHRKGNHNPNRLPRLNLLQLLLQTLPRQSQGEEILQPELKRSFLEGSRSNVCHTHYRRDV